MGLGFILFIGGLVIMLALYFWSRQREERGYTSTTAEPGVLKDLPLATSDDAVLVSREHGQLVYINDRARKLLGLNGGDPNLEYIARMAQPTDSFLDLFSGEGQASFQMGERWMEASSHNIPSAGEMRRVVVMREISANTNNPDVLDLSLAIRTINEIGETVNAAMSVEQVHQALLTIVMKAVPGGAGEICVWDETGRVLRPQGWVGNTEYLLKLSENGGSYKPGEGITGWIAQHRKPLLVASIYDGTAVQPKFSNFFKSFVGVPLNLGERFIGTFELSDAEPNHFTQGHLALLQAVSKQLATAIYNAQLYASQSQRINDMASLQDVAHGQERAVESQAIFKVLTERVARLVHSNIAGILMYDENRRALVPELPFFGLPDSVAQNLLISLPPDSPQRDIWEQSPHWVSNDVMDDDLIEALGLKALFSVAGVRNMALLPLEIGQQRIGMLQVSNKQSTGGFSNQDILEIRMLAAQAAIVVENIRLNQRDQRRDSELGGLQDITRAIGALSREGEFYSTITASIAELMSISMCGILLYNEAEHRLESRLPFFGIPDEAISNYAINLEPGSPLEEIWEDVDYWYTNRVQADAVVYAAGLGEFAERVGVQKTLLAVLSVGGRRLGVVQASNKLNGEDFNDKDARLLLIFATQAAAMIENSRLYRDMERSTDEAIRLRRVAELAGTVLTQDEPFTPVLAEIAALTRSPLVFINVLDQQTGSLITYPRWVYGTELHEPVVYDVYSKHFEHSVALSHQPFVSNSLEDDGRVLETYRQSTLKFSLKRSVIVPLVVGDRSLGELGIANREGSLYDEYDVTLMTAIATQIAATIERLRLVEAQGQNLTRRMQELDAISNISNELTQTLELERVLDVIRHEAARATNADGSTVVLLKPSSQWKTPDMPEMEQRLGERNIMPALADIEQEAISRGADTVLVSNYSTSSLDSAPKIAQSAIAGAFLYEDEVVGVIHLYHTRQNHFDDRAAAFLLTMGAKASLGFGNAKRYLEQLERSARLRRRVEQLNQIFELGQMLQTNVDQVTLLEAILYSIQQSVGFDIGVVALVDEQAGVLRRAAQVGMPLDEFERSKAHAMTLDDLVGIMQQESYRISESYFIPAEARSHFSPEIQESLSTDFSGKRMMPPSDDPKGWQPGDMLLIPLLGPGGNPLGMMSLDQPQDGLRPDRTTMEVLEIFTHQASATMENIRLYLATLQNVEQETRLNEMMETVAGTLDVDEIVQSVAYGALRLVPFTRMTVALLPVEGTGFDMLKVDVSNPTTIVVTREQHANLDHTALLRALGEGQDALYYTGDPAIEMYTDLREWHIQGERTTLIVPLVAGGVSLGAMHMGSELNQAFGFEEFRPLLKRMANLSAVAIQNARLFNQAINLQSFNESVVESIQQGIVVLDKEGRILSFNDFMRERYQWDEEQSLRQHLFEYRPDLEDILKDDIKSVLDKGKPRERIGKNSYLANGAAIVRNFYTYPLRSADSIRGAVLLVEDVTDRAMLERDLEARANQLAVLTEVSSRITASLNREEVISLALDEIGRVIPFDTMTLWSRVGQLLHLEGSRGFGEDVAMVSDEESMIQIESHERLRTLVERKQSYSISNLQGWDALPGESGTKSWLGVPLVNQGDVVGVIALSKAEPRFYDSQSEQAAFAFANQVAIALSNAGLFAETQYKSERMGLLNKISDSLAQSLDSENILEIALQEISHAMKVGNARALVFERDLQVGRVVVQYPRGDTPPEEVIDLQEHPIYKSVLRSATSLLVEDVQALEPTDFVRQVLEPRGVRAYAIIPMTVGGQAIGAFELEVFTTSRTFSAEQVDLGTTIANQAAIAVQNTNLLEQTLVRTRELETLLEAAQATSLTLNLEDAYRSVCQLILHALDVDDCAVMMWDNVQNTLEVQIDLSRYGEENKIAPAGTIYNLRQSPTKRRSLEEREIVVVRSAGTGKDVEETQEVQIQGDGIRVLIPLVVRDQSIGLLQAQQLSSHRTFGHREIRLAQALGAQAAIAIQNARLSSETAALVEEGFIINNLSQAISSTLTIEDMIEIVRDQIPRVTDAEELYLALYDVATQNITFPVAVKQGENFEIPARTLNTDEVSFIIKHRRPLVLGGGNWSSDEMRRNLSISNGEGAAKSYLGVPVAAGDQVLGVLAIRDSGNGRAFGINDERLLQTVGTQLGAAIQNARLFNQVTSFNEELNQRVQERTEELQASTEELQRERDRIDTLYRITSELARTLDMDRVLKRALEMVAQAVTAGDGVIMLIDPLSDRLLTRAALHSTNNTQHPAEMLATWLLNNERTALVDDLSQAPYWKPNAPGAAGWGSALAVLLESNDDPQGVMVLLDHEKNAFNETQLKLVIAAANQVASAINNADLYHLIRDQAERLGTLVRVEQEEAEKNSAIVESIADGVMLADAEGIIVLFNQAAERILELPRDQVIGQAMFKLTGLFGGSAEQWTGSIESWSRNPSAYNSSDYLEETLDLGKRVVSVHLSPVNIGERFLGTVSVFRDITKEVEVDRVKSEFVASVSHELRTPMTSIKGFADLLLMGVVGQVSDPQKDFLLKIKSNADRLSQLVNDLLNISKIDAGERLNVELVDLNELIPSVISNLESRAEHEKKHMQVHMDVGAGIPPVQGDPHKLTQIITNVVDNAYNYTYEGGNIDVTAALQPDGQHVLISVKDTGIGIPDDFKSRIWGRFERYEDAALVMDVPGTGLGLSIVKELVQMHNGNIWFDSELGKGTTFYIELPVEQPETQPV